MSYVPPYDRFCTCRNCNSYREKYGLKLGEVFSDAPNAAFGNFELRPEALGAATPISMPQEWDFEPGDRRTRMFEPADVSPEIPRRFASGATRDQDTTKYDYEGFLSPLVVEAFGAYMHRHRKMADGTVRDSDNWQKGIPLAAYIKSGFRHLLDWWKEHRGLASREGMVFAILGVLFNAQGYLHEYLKDNPGALSDALARNAA